MAVANIRPPAPEPAWADLVGRGLRTAASVDLQSLSTSDLGDGVEALCRIGDVVQAEMVRWLRQHEQRHGPAADGAPSTVAWLSLRGRMSPGRAADLVCVSRQLPELPATARALREGEIGYQHASVMARTANQVGPQAVREAEHDLLVAARAHDVRSFAHVARHFRECVDADGALDDANRDHERSRIHLSQTYGGCWRVDGWLDTEGGALLTSALNPLMKPLPGDRRTGSQRRGAALLELCRRQLDGGRLPLVGGQRPHLFVSVPVETLRGEPGSPGGELRWGGPVPGEAARRLACDAVRTEVIVGAGGVPLRVGPPAKTILAPIRRHLIARDGGCRFPGCIRPPEWCDAHHVRPREVGGPTVLENLVLLCRFHHRCVHEGGWRIRVGPETAFEFVAPGARPP
jgi:transposase-like protein